MASDAMPGATALVDMFRRGALSPVEAVEASLTRIDRLNPALNAFTALCPDRARAEAQAAERRYRDGAPLGPLDGVPLGVKDLQETEGLLTTYGSPDFRGHVPARDLPMVARLRAAGAIVVGKTNVPEMGAGGNTRNPVWGATGNPFDPRLIAGGSSGGSAAALAAGMVPLCTGSDTGGSLRLPAALCGIVGYRPSTDVVAHPTRPLGWSAISVLGPMARDVTDLAFMLGVCAGFDAGDPLSGRHDAGAFPPGASADLAGLRIGYSEDFGACPVDPDIRAGFRARVEALAPRVAECRPVDLSLGDMDRCFDILRAESFVAAFEKTFRETPARLGPNVRANVELAGAMTLADRAWAHLEQTRILRAFNAAIAPFDIIVMPTAPLSPFPWAEPFATEIDGVAMDTYYRWLALTYRGSLTGGPALTLPVGRDGRGMPFGLQVLGHVKEDARLLRAARALEAHFAAQPGLGRPEPDLDRLAATDAGLRSVVTHPPLPPVGAGGPAALTAV